MNIATQIIQLQANSFVKYWWQDKRICLYMNSSVERYILYDVHKFGFSLQFSSVLLIIYKVLVFDILWGQGPYHKRLLQYGLPLPFSFVVWKVDDLSVFYQKAFGQPPQDIARRNQIDFLKKNITRFRSKTNKGQKNEKAKIEI